MSLLGAVAAHYVASDGGTIGTTVVQSAKDSGTAATGNTKTATFASTPNAGNMMIVVVNAAITGTITGPSGWTERTLSGGVVTGTTAVYKIFEKVAGAGESKNVSIQFSAPCRYGIIAMELPANAFDLLTESAGSSTASYAASGITTTAHDIVLTIVCLGGGLNSTMTYSWDNGFTLVDSAQVANTSNAIAMAVAQKEVASSTASGTTTVALNLTRSIRGIQIGYKLN